MSGEPRRFSTEELVIARMALRRAADQAPPLLELREFIDLMCVEIRMLRAAGFMDEEIAVIVERAVRYPIAPEDIGRCESADAHPHESMLGKAIPTLAAVG